MSTRRPRRLLAACHRCHSQKIKCSGDKPCQSCNSTGRADECEFPANKERKIPVSESYLKKLEEDSRKLQAISTHNQTPEPTPFNNVQDDSPPSLSKEESNLFNPLFDRQPEKPIQERSSEPGFIGEASCAAFSNRLLSCLDDTYTPSTAGLSNYLKLNTYDRLAIPEFPERMHVKLLLNVARRFIGNYHPLFLEVTFMKEIDAVYRREMVPSSLWLCKFYALMALGEIYTHRRGVGDNNRVPGTNYYVRAVGLLQENQDYYEEPSLMQVEVLTLLAWASNVLGRIRTAYCYSGIAMRIAQSLGMHRSASRHTTLTPVERESRRRTWWVLYFFDRFSASKLGQPITVRDEDIDVEMPSQEGLTREEMAEFLDPQNLITNIKLARIIGNILTHIYGIPKATNGLYIHQVHGILKQLRAWHDDLRPDMRVKERGTPRPVASLHLAYNQCIIQTTRPVLLHLFKTQFQLTPASKPRQNVSSITLALAESCVNAAQASSRIVEGLFLDGSIATFGYWDAHHIFSAAMILIMSAVMKPTAVNSDHLETLLSVLRSLKNDGNIPAVDFCERLSHIQTRVSTLRATGRLDGIPPVTENQQNITENSAFQTPMSMDGSGLNDAGIIDYENVDILGNPLIGSFLDGNQVQWLDVLFSEDGTLKEFASEIEEQFLFR
ncbi:fungal-specific transcription factor domain-containing protein [Fusarium flagelliforme]|uniref:fungal-specific transcription factor domain-containing protein n=1 Tax=Fusarium flagelliforme TaxID=2675880 RepID=UPI001E8EEF1E|nr:fungal-specific transcription factor domain-containing protein [Fusarium flagelliforme]KAH7182459.1 fungal-specific transcription factor domain-containing protein [Fusarium flagelliforme]